MDKPFLWIADVLEGSPAKEAGLLLGDAILEFGQIREASGSGDELLMTIKALVESSLNSPIGLKILRKSIMEEAEILDV